MKSQALNIEYFILDANCKQKKMFLGFLVADASRKDETDSTTK